MFRSANLTYAIRNCKLNKNAWQNELCATPRNLRKFKKKLREMSRKLTISYLKGLILIIIEHIQY